MTHAARGALVGALTLLTPQLAQSALTFDAGSDGSDGSIFVAAGTSLELPLPADGILHATDVTVEAGGVLTFTHNVNNTPVYLLSQGDVVIQGTVDVSGGDSVGTVPGSGGPNGWRGGSGGSVVNDYHNPWVGSTIQRTRLLPIGNGGGNGNDCAGGGGGGGALLLAADTTITVDGLIDAGGGNGGCMGTPDVSGAGRGGRIRLVAPRVTGTGEVDATGGQGGFGGGGIGGGIYIDAVIDESLDWVFTSHPDSFLGDPLPPSRSTTMFALPAVLPQVRIVSVGGQTVDQEDGPFLLTVPDGQPLTQEVVVDVQGFGSSGTVSVQGFMQAMGNFVNPGTQFGTVDLSTTNQVTLSFDLAPSATYRLTAWARQ